MSARSSWAAVGSGLALVVLGGITGCGGPAGGRPGAAAASKNPGASSPAARARRCGTARTAAGVPVEVEVAHGSAACSQALTVERGYTRALESGKVPGNGGGAPVTVLGWVCQGYNTPQVLASGTASACRRGTAAIIAVLPEPKRSSS